MDMSEPIITTSPFTTDTHVFSERGGYLADLFKRRCLTDILNRIRSRTPQALTYLERATALYAHISRILREQIPKDEKLLIVEIEQGLPPYAGLLFAHLMHPRVRVLSIGIGPKDRAKQVILMKKVSGMTHQHYKNMNELKNAILNGTLPEYTPDMNLLVISLKGDGVIYKMFRRFNTVRGKMLAMFIPPLYYKQFAEQKIRNRIPKNLIIDSELKPGMNCILIDGMAALANIPGYQFKRNRKGRAMAPAPASEQTPAPAPSPAAEIP